MAEQPLIAPPNLYGSIQPLPLPDMQMPQFTQPSQPESAPLDTGSATVKYSPSLDSFYVNGRTFKADDETQKVKSLEYFNDPTPRPAPQGDWVSLDTAGYLGHVREITDPGTWRLFSRNFGIGVDNLQQLAGYGLQLAGAETLGKSIVEQQAQDLAKVEPYQRSFSDIGSSPERGVTDWLVASIAQQGPNIVETLVTTALGFAGGSAAGGGINPVTGVGGAVASLVGKGVIKEQLAAITAKVLANNELKAAGKAIVPLTLAETKVLKTAAGIAGGAAASIANSYALGASDIYGETVQSGEPNRLAAVLGGIPYAALDLFPEAVIASKMFGGTLRLNNRALADISTKRGKAGEILKRGAIGGTAGGLLEGSTEAAQELLLLAANPNEDFESDSGKLRVLNAFAAGFGIGAPIGGGAQILTAGKLKAGKATDVLAGGDPDPTATPALPSPPQPGDAGYNEGETDPFMQARREQMFAPPPLPTLDPFADRRRAFLGEPAVIIPQGQANLMQNLRDISSGPVPQAAPQSIAQPNLLTQPRLPAQPVQTALPPQGNMLLQQLQNLIPQQVAPPTNPLMAARMGEALAGQQQAQQQQAIRNAAFVPAQNAVMQQEIAQYNAPNMRMPTAIPEAAAPQVPTTQPTQMSLPGMAPPKSKFLQRGVQAQPAVQESYGPSAQIPFNFGAQPAAPVATSPAAPFTLKLTPQNTPEDIAKQNKAALAKLKAKETPVTPQGAVSPVGKPEEGSVPSETLQIEAPKRAANVTASVVNDLAEATSLAEAKKPTANMVDLAFSGDEDAVGYVIAATAPNSGIGKTIGQALRSSLKDKITSILKADPTASAKEWIQFAKTYNLVPELKGLLAKATDLPADVQEFVNTPSPISPEEQAKEARLSMMKALTKARQRADGLFLRLDGTPIPEPMVIGRVKMLVAGMVRKFVNAPTVHVAKNVADLKATNPKLYERANAAREAGDFATTKAVGYSFGKDIIIFSDFVQTEQQLKFVLAHEALGHFGFKSIMSDANLKSMLNQAYNQDSEVRNAADELIDLHGMSKLEAIEEVLAQRAAELDTSTIRRVWNFIKNALNRMGFEFDDDAARMLIHQSRMYVRRGITGNFFSNDSVTDTISDMTQTAMDGMFSRSDVTFASAASGGLNRVGDNLTVLDNMRSFFTSPDKLQQAVKITADIFSTLDQKARHSEGLTTIYNLFKAQNNLARSLISQLEDMNKFTGMGSVFGGPSQDDLTKAGQYLAQARMYMLQSTKDSDITGYGSLFVLNGSGYPTLNKAVADQVMADGLVTADQFRKGFEIKNALGELQEKVQENIDESSKAWKIYLEQRAVVNKAALDKLEQTYLSAQYQQTELVSDVVKALLPEDTSATQAEVSALKAIIKQYRSILESDIVSSIGTDKVEPSEASTALAKDFLYEVTRAFYKTDKMKDWLSPQAGSTEKAATIFAVPEYDKVRAALTTLQRMNISGDKALGDIQQHIANSVFSEVDARNAEIDAKTTIRTSYAPLIHRGKYEVRLVAYDKSGNPVQLAEAFKDVMPTPRADSIDEVDGIIDGFKNKETGQKENGLAAIWEGKDFDVVNSDGKTVSVRFRVESGKAAVNRSVGESGDFSNFVNYLARNNVSITPQERERLVVSMTKQGDSRRSRLRFSGNPGFNADVVGSIADHIETSSHVSAKIRYRRQTDAVMLNKSAWQGEPSKLKALRLAVDAEKDPSRKAQAVREYNDYAYKYVYSAPKRRPAVDMLKEDGSVAKTVATKGEGNSYFNEASALIEWHGQQLDTANAVEDALSGPVVSRIKTAVVTMQLGGSVATAMVNLLSLGTHSLNYLATYNPARSYGLGYGYSKAFKALSIAGKDVGNYKLADSDYLTKLVEKPWTAGERRNGMTEDEAKYLLSETLTGSLQPSEANTLLGTKRGGIRSGNVQAGIRGYMFMFSYTEAYNRRVTALATYRLEKERALAEGLTESEAQARSRVVTSRTIDMTQGQYAMYNRPRIAYDGIGSLLFMYKQFVVLTLGMMRNLPPSGQAAMIGTILLLSGLKGVPFADDLLDLADFLMQSLGIKKKSAEGEVMLFLNSIVPGLTPYIMRGLVDEMTGATVSSRSGFGDIIPLTGALNYGSDPVREIANFAGPIVGGITSIATNAKDIVSYAAEVVGLKPDITTIKDIMRKSPFAGVRALSDTLVYYQDGKVTTSDGKVALQTVGPMVLGFRLLGFMPADTTKTNDVIRISKGGGAYVAAVKKDFVDAYRRAAVSNNRADMTRIKQQVKQHNIDAKGTGFEIKDFDLAIKKAAKEAMSSSSIRYLRTVPKGLKQDVIDYLNVYGLDVKDGAVQ